jgi:hypothetical protein
MIELVLRVYGWIFMVHGSRFTVHGSWFMVHGSRFMELRINEYDAEGTHVSTCKFVPHSCEDKYHLLAPNFLVLSHNSQLPP